MNSLRHPPAWRIAPWLLCLLAGLSGCSRAEANDTEAAEREIRDLVTALTPPPATEIPVVKSEYYVNRKSTLERLRKADESRGLEALRVYREERPALPEVCAGLLDVAAHAAPAATEELLVELVTTFGEDLYIRRAATELLGQCMPRRAVEVLEPVLRERPDGRTYPPEERMLEAWLQASVTLGQDPVPLLALVATDLQRPQEVRHLATKALGSHPSPLGRQALETLLVESSGNGYIRRLALQALRESSDPTAYCETIRRVQANEADPDFIAFLQSALDERCR